MKINILKKNQIAFKEWIYLSVILICLTAFLSSFNGLGRLDQTLYDHFLQLQTHEARDDIIIVAIDDYSLKELGKWPWPRERHAELIEQLTKAKPLAIGLDILFPEAGQNNPLGDQLLASAISNNGKVVLPIVAQQSGQGLQAAPPTLALAHSAKKIAHINIELDTDGVARSVFLYEGMQQIWWPHFALALHNIGREIKTDAYRQSQLPGARAPTSNIASTENSAVWRRDFHMHIPYYGSSGHFTSVPYVAVLRGEVPDSFFKNKYVLVGATAQGMADAYTTPTTSNQGAISGIEINANILASLLDGRSISLMHAGFTIAIFSLAILIALLTFLTLSPRLALISTSLIFIGLLALSFTLLRFGYWLPPSAGLIVLTIAYPLWSWRRLEAAIRFLGDEFIVLNKEPHLLPELSQEEDETAQPKKAIQDKLDQHIEAMHIAVKRVRDFRQFITDSLHSLPDATLITNRDGNVVLANPTAMAYFKSVGSHQVIDALLPYLFANMNFPTTEIANARSSFSWWHLLDPSHNTLLLKGVEVVDQKGRDLIIKSAPCYSGTQELVGWIVSIIDISVIKQAEKRRDETLHFISHDMRAPQSSILALIELQKKTETQIPFEEFIQRIEKASNTTLSLADGFVQLAQAEANEYKLQDHDFQDLLLDATEELWSLAKAKNIKIVTNIPEDEYYVQVDRSLMTRVLVNLISNAIKYSPNNTTITCTLAVETQSLNDSVVCTIEDQGYGIARADHNKLFQRYQRFQHNKHGEKHQQDGIGLGMVFVKTVLDRHFAKISFTSTPGEGTCFKISIATQASLG